MRGPERWALTWLLALAWVLPTAMGCAARRRGPDEPAPGEAWVRKVRIRGAETLDASDIKEGLATQSPRGRIVVHKTRLDTSLIERDRARIRTYYQTRGFFDAKVTAVDIKKVSAKKSDVVFHVSEGEQSNVAEVYVSGLPTDVSEDSEFHLGVERGDAFDHKHFLGDRSAIETAMLENGYAHVDVAGRAEVDRTGQKVALRYTIDAGPKVYFGDIDVRGLNIIPKSAVFNRLEFETGELYSPRKISLTRAKIQSLGRFGIVRVDFRDEGEVAEGGAGAAPGDVLITVTEAPRNESKLGVGLGIDQNNYEFRGRAEYTYHGLIHPLLSASILAKPAYVMLRADTTQRQLAGEFSTSLVREDLIWPLARGKATLGFDVDALEAYSSQGGDLHLKMSRLAWRQRVQLGVGWRMELLDFTRVVDAIDANLRETLGLSSPYRSAFFEQSIALDLRNRPLNASQGLYAAVTVEEAGSFAGGEFGYGRISPELRAYQAFGERFRLAAKATLGWPLWGTLPITRRFFSGGANRHRGFAQRRLSPVASAGTSGEVGIGGDKLAGLIVESRINITELWDEWLGVTVFVDGGDVVQEEDDISLTNLHWALGTGLRYQTLVGPIRFDVGYRVNRYGDGEIRARDRLQLHLLIGEAF
ncbi:MAG: BamA/TamA family outer membrane protein [Myxococcales bacterium]|nr:BamA/TamA family outer membrane protein [Myxococcales bacterium]